MYSSVKGNSEVLRHWWVVPVPKVRQISKEVQEIRLKWYDQVYRKEKENVRKSDDDGCGGGEGKEDRSRGG